MNLYNCMYTTSVFAHDKLNPFLRIIQKCGVTLKDFLLLKMKLLTIFYTKFSNLPKHSKLNFLNSLSVGTFFSMLKSKYLNIRMKGS